ncbi:MAG: excinuclease ABC subunit UvrA [Christensenellales bacterium]|jgi:excinuclease ABC subunit A
MCNNCLTVRGARENNLKSLNLTIPRDKLVVFTGLSGSGKTSLAFDTIYAEGQRRYVESLSSYARMFLGQMNKPDVDAIEGLSPAISIDQKTTSHNPRSTVGTVTEIHDYLRLLYANIGLPHCPSCGKAITRQSVDQMVDTILKHPEGTRLTLLSPLVRRKKGEHQKVLESVAKRGFVRVRVDGTVYDVSEVPALDKKFKHSIDVVVDRLIVRDGIRSRLAGSLETAMELSDGLVIADADGEETTFSQNYACPDCNISMEELTPRMFSFNNPFGACPTCTGLGTLMKIDPDLIIPDKTLTLNQGAVRVTGWYSAAEKYGGSIANMYLNALSEKYGFSLDVPVEQLPKSVIDILLYGTGDEKLKLNFERDYGSGTMYNAFEGIVNNLERRYKETQSDYMKAEIESYMSHTPCPDCHGQRLKKTVLAVTVGGLSIAQVSDMSVLHAREFFKNLRLTETEHAIADNILREIDARLGFLCDVGLDYLTLSRGASTLSGGEAQRIRLATQIGSGLMGVLYILDEPSIGLHQRDNSRLLATLKHLRDLGNTLIVVEHDEETIREADHIVDIGPMAGAHGGELVAQGRVEDLIACERSITGKYLSGELKIEVPKARRPVSDRMLTVKGARANNLKNITVSFPLGVFVCITGVSGSGKSSLVNEIVKKTLLRDLNRAKTRPAEYDAIEGIEHLDKVIDIDQSPIGRTPRSNPATYTGVFDLIREVFAMTPEAKAKGFTNGRFSFNVKGGRCEACKGDGIKKIEMHFLPDVYVPCETCGGKRYNRETLEVHYKGKTIADVLDMTVEEAYDFFSALPRIERKLATLMDVGLSYIRLGQPSTTLSGGEAQRVKLATELSRRPTDRTLYILDEPTTGLHMYDVSRLIDILQRLASNGNTVLVIEHNLDVIKTADYVIDLGPEGGDRGGEIIATGTPEEVAQVEGSFTGQYLKKVLEAEKN